MKIISIIFCVLGIAYYTQAISFTLLCANKMIKNYGRFSRLTGVIVCLFAAFFASIFYVVYDTKRAFELLTAILAGADLGTNNSDSEKNIDFSTFLTKFCNSITNTKNRGR